MRSKQRPRLQVEELEARLALSTYYVATTGNDGNAGASQTPWKTIQHAADLVQAGDIVVVRAGNYAGFIMGWDTPTAGTANAPITFEADPNAAPGSVVINACNSNTPSGIDLEPGCDYITIQGFKVQGGGTSGIGAYPNKGSGIKVTGNHDSVIGNTVINVDYGFGIFSNNANNVLIQGNTISGTGSHGNSSYGHGIYVAGDCDGATVTGNIIHDNDYIGLHINGDPGLVTHALIADNAIYNNGQNGINADGLQSSTIQNNLIYGYANYGIVLYQIDASDSPKNNTIVNNTIFSTRSGASMALRIKDGGTGTVVRNNILLGDGGVTYRISDDSLPGLVSDYNVVGSLFRSDDTGNDQSFASWKSQTGQDAHSFIATASALFVDAANNDYHLSSSSPATDAGTATSAPGKDAEGNTRPQGNGYDLGAYETSAPSTSSSTTTTSDTISSTTTSADTPSSPTRVQPTARLTGPSAGVRGQSLTFTLTASEAGLADGSSFTFSIDWNGDGKVDQTVSSPSGTLVTHVFTSNGSYTVKVTATDPSGNASVAASQGVQIVSVALQTDPLNPSKTALVVGGTNGDDKIVLTPDDTKGTIKVTINGNSQGTYLPTGHVFVYGQAGSDTIQLASRTIKNQLVYITVQAMLFGGDGGDTLDARGSTANSVQVGGAGNDTLYGGYGRDVLIGGTGADILRDGGADDIEVGDGTVFDNNLAALDAVMAEWGRTDLGYQARVQHLQGGAGGLNSSYFLTNATLVKDRSVDYLYVSSGLDWLLYDSSRALKDRTSGLQTGEIATPL